MSSINWSTPNIWVFVVQLVEHCSSNDEAMGSNPAEALNFFWVKTSNCLNCDYNCDDLDFLCIPAVQNHLHFTNNYPSSARNWI